MDEISALIEETPESLLSPSTMGGKTARRRPSLNQEAGSHQTLNMLMS